ncbi:SPFH domain-containing protein [Nocardioides aurantiacus]|uniref:SPFH domain/Band 7 family protein n=1 Tax=Nocardioides aurantiacus TaxID=86796 RepID=A0A3N2CWY8_9ACTN|nr:SPFH domain-containing protein [Nocardioides aurantiacus]ROR91983.1 SPFH domain/Band 7 family protein [Nocardioides aurantiacus]
MSLLTLTVHVGESLVVQRAGRASTALGPGRHPRPWRGRVRRVELREQLTRVPTQEVPTADGVAVKVSAVLRWRVVDPVRHVEAAVEPVEVVYLAVQVALREVLAALPLDEVAARVRTVAAEPLLAAARRAGATTGVEVLEVVVKDVVLPAEVRSAYAEVVTGRQRAVVQLEAARAETAALRSLANGAKLLDEHPALARLRIVQALPPGSTVRLGEE